jgi:glucosamine--fructose-6-phosphate aminotransferase (isomerizing)
MCGIVGYIGVRDTQQVLTDGLKRLEYRGYDSAGVAIYTRDGLVVEKAKGRIAQLEDRLKHRPLVGSVGIGHTRWATHGEPSDVNSHPHTDNENKISVVHNGIIENYVELKQELEAQGCTFVSETDTEVISHLIATLYEGDIVAAVQKAVRRMKGAFALAVLAEQEPDRLIAARLSSPLIIGVGNGENFIGSDIPAILEYTRTIYVLNDAEMAVLTRDNVEFMTVEGNFIVKESLYVDWDCIAAEKAGFDHFMIKEIHEQPKALRDTMVGRLDARSGAVLLDKPDLSRERIRSIDRIHIVACGTAYHAGLVGKTLIERLARIPVEADIASEYRYRSPIVTDRTLMIAVSQSGETADTLAAMREAKRWGAHVMAITNVVGSSVAREADDVILTCAGPEIAVASTKAYTSQVMAFNMLALHLAEIRVTVEERELQQAIEQIAELPDQVERILEQKERINKLAERWAKNGSMFFIGRGLDYAVALEGSLKLKEISYIHSEAYAAGELKHGTLSLIEPGTPVIAVATQVGLLEKTCSNIKEIKARGGVVLAIASESLRCEVEDYADEVLTIPDAGNWWTPILSVIPLQLFAYYAAVERGNDVDKPRNLAKSVTVE